MVEDLQADVVVLGSGLAGLATGLAAAEKGLRVIVLESSSRLGGGTTNSYGLIWVANNHLAQKNGYSDTREEALDYVRFLAGGQAIEENLLAFVDYSRVALKFFEACGLRFKLVPSVSDHYYGIAPGAKQAGRSLEVELISGSVLGDLRDSLNIPFSQPTYITAEEQISWGGVNNFSNWDAKLIQERLDKDMRGKGVGLICHLLRALIDRQVTIRTGIDTTKILFEDGKAVGVETSNGNVRAGRAVVLATGGYESNPELVESFEGLPDWVSQTPSSVKGDGLYLGTKAGGAVHQIQNNMQLFLGWRISDPAAYDSECHIAGIVELCSPHTILVNKRGLRFGDETYFQRLAPRLREFDTLSHGYVNLPCFMIFDQEYADNYSFAGRPKGTVIPDWVRQAASLSDLAQALDIDPDQLQSTVERFNGYVDAGRDDEFQRGELAWRLAKRKGLKDNPSLGKIARPPYYGVQLHPAAGGSAGLLINRNGMVLDARREPIAGLYAIGNVAARTEFGAGYQAGYTLASGMTFGLLAVEHMLTQ